MARPAILASLAVFGSSTLALGQGILPQSPVSPQIPVRPLPPVQTQPATWQPIIPASVAPNLDGPKPLVARPLTADPRFQPSPYQFPAAEPRALPQNFTSPQPQQFPKPQNLLQPGMPFPSATGQPSAQGPTDWNPLSPMEDIKLPQKEKAARFEGSTVTARKFQDTWQVWSGGVLLRDFGKSQADADEAVRLIRELRTTEWVGIGAGRPVVEYGLTNGRAHLPTYTPKVTTAIDMGSVRVDNIRGVWCLRDDSAILVNFGRDRDDAEQAVAVIRRYGFNRLGLIGNPTQMAVLFAQPGLTPRAGTTTTPSGLGQLAKISQEQTLTRTGIEVPGVGFVGERLVLDPKKVEVRREKGEYVLAHGTDVLARFGLSEWSARDALRVVQDLRATEFCRFNADVTFFLVNGQPPTRPPFSVQGTRFDPERLQVKPASGGQLGIYDSNGRLMYSVGSKEEAEALVKLLQHYQFNQQCQLGLSGRNGLKFLAKVGR